LLSLVRGIGSGGLRLDAGLADIAGVREFLRNPWLPVLSAAAGVAYVDRGADPGDLVYFVHSGERLLSGGWAQTFADPLLQSGPLQLVVFGAVRNLAALAFVIELGVAALLLFVLGRLHVANGLRLALGFVAVGAGLTHLAFADGHPAEAVVPLLWVLAGVWAREDRLVAAGALLGVSAGLELWGVLGGVVLLLAPRLRRTVVGLSTGGVVVAAQLAPFVLLGDFRMFDHRWNVAGGSALSLVVAPGTHFGWPLRLAQAALAVATGAAVALKLRSRLHAVWAAPLAVVLVRLLLDPISFGWYWLEAEALALVGAALVLTELQSRFPAARLLRAAATPRPAAAPPHARS
jgi:hypothetical protein